MTIKWTAKWEDGKPIMVDDQGRPWAVTRVLYSIFDIIDEVARAFYELGLKEGAQNKCTCEWKPDGDRVIVSSSCPHHGAMLKRKGEHK